MPCKIWGFTAVTMKNVVFLAVDVLTSHIGNVR
jgi:hypothetical protein